MPCAFLCVLAHCPYIGQNDPDPDHTVGPDQPSDPDQTFGQRAAIGKLAPAQAPCRYYSVNITMVVGGQHDGEHHHGRWWSR